MKTSKNDLCPCGSGKKYSECCMDRNLEKGDEADDYDEDEDDYDEDDYDEDDYDEDDYDEDEEELYDKEINDYIKKLFSDDRPLDEIMLRFINDMHISALENKPHIKEYKKIRALHREVLVDMMKFNEEGKFKQRIINTDLINITKNENLILINTSFNLNTELGEQAFANVFFYKNSTNLNCVTEEFLEKKLYRKQEKINFLESMLNSHAGLFMVTKTDSEEGYAYIKDMLSGNEFRITDIGLSGMPIYDHMYSYMRIITYNDTSFGTGLSLIFKKDDPFIKEWIKKNKKNYNPKEEIGRFIELYNRYSNEPKKITPIGNRF